MTAFGKEIGFAAFCLALGLLAGFFAGRKWEHEPTAVPAAELTELLARTEAAVMALLTDMPQLAVQDNAAVMIGRQAMAVAVGKQTDRRVDIGDSVLISADQRGFVYAICVEK